MKDDECKIRREGFPLTRKDAKALLDFIEIHNSSHDMIEPEIVVKLELIAGLIKIGIVVPIEKGEEEHAHA